MEQEKREPGYAATAPPPTHPFPADKSKPGEKCEFEKKVGDLINRMSLENESNTPDFILAQYLKDCLVNFNTAMRQREACG